jgi:hypothetical protein
MELCRIEQEMRAFLPILRRRLTESRYQVSARGAQELSAMIEKTCALERLISLSLGDKD